MSSLVYNLLKEKKTRGHHVFLLVDFAFYVSAISLTLQFVVMFVM
jgi:hypothetical protein